MKQLINFNPFFDPTEKTLDFRLFPNFQSDLLYGVINVTRNQILYAPGTSTYGGNWTTPTLLTLIFDTSSYATTDLLNIYYETQPGTIYNNDPVENGGYSEATYITSQLILAELRVQTFMMAEAFRISQADVNFARNDALNPANNSLSDSD
jgi:hypothetical protein